jgi:parallel beta-helix repeat protein
MTHIQAWPPILLGALCVVFSAVTAGSASAAVLCVGAKQPGCFSTITAAIAAANPGDTVQVASGMYREQVVINKPLSLIGADTANTIIDAGGSNTTSGGNGVGIYLNGMDNLTPAKKLIGGTGLTEVVVQGFTVINAQFEGILVTNASNITIVENHVTGSNRGLQVPTNPGGCPFIPPWETSEGFDCGEGIHLAAVRHSTVANNIVDHNAGGILLTDETGPNHDNLITGNQITENGYDCGITLASHRPPTNLGFGSDPTVAFGVFRNTVAYNESSNNGLAVSGNGIGVGIFTSPGPPTFPTMQTAAYDNVVIGNRLIGNGQPGVALHAHKAGATLTGNLVTGNYIAFNGPDVADNATPGPTGINVDGGASGVPLTGNSIIGNVIENESVDVAIRTEASTQIDVHLNDLLGDGIGVANQGAGRVNATQNYWGCPGGPLAAGCSTTSGDVTVKSSLTRRLDIGEPVSDPLNPGVSGKPPVSP